MCQINKELKIKIMWKIVRLKTYVALYGRVKKKSNAFSPLCVCVLKILNILKRKNSGLIPHWKMSVS